MADTLILPKLRLAVKFNHPGHPTLLGANMDRKRDEDSIVGTLNGFEDFKRGQAQGGGVTIDTLSDSLLRRNQRIGAIDLAQWQRCSCNDMFNRDESSNGNKFELPISRHKANSCGDQQGCETQLNYLTANLPSFRSEQ